MSCTQDVKRVGLTCTLKLTVSPLHLWQGGQRPLTSRAVSVQGPPGNALPLRLVVQLKFS